MLFSGPGLTPSLKGAVTNVVGLQPGETSVIFPAGWYMLRCGKYTVIQQLDPITGTWRCIGGGGGNNGVDYIYSDGVNYRLANLTGTVIGANITNVGSGYTTASPPILTVSGSQGAILKPIVGGAISTTVTVSHGGSNYTYPPNVQFDAPPPGGIQATGYATLTSGAVSSVTVIDQGAGYLTAPKVTFTNDYRELNPQSSAITTGAGAQARTSLTGAGTITGVLCLDQGQGTADGTQTISVAGGAGSSAAFSPIFCLSITSYSLGGTNTGWANFPLTITAADSPLVTGSTYSNPTTGQVTAIGNLQQDLIRTRPATIVALPSGGVIPAATSARFVDGGIYSQKPTQIEIISAPATTPAATTGTVTMGGYNDVSYITQL